MDGEVAILTKDGVSDFDALHGRTNDAWAILLAFDLLEIEGEDLRDQPLVERKRRLRRLLSRRDDGLQYVEFLEGDGVGAGFAKICAAESASVAPLARWRPQVGAISPFSPALKRCFPPGLCRAFSNVRTRP
jgi:hypothetical protein